MVISMRDTGKTGATMASDASSGHKIKCTKDSGSKGKNKAKEHSITKMATNTSATSRRTGGPVQELSNPNLLLLIPQIVLRIVEFSNSFNDS